MMKYNTKYFLFLFMLISCFQVYANMAKPFADGTKSSALFGSKDCKVLNEKISMTVVASDKIEDDPEIYRIRYKISYVISSEKEASLPLLFIGQRMKSASSVLVNGKKISFPKITSETIAQFPFIKGSQSGGDFYDIRFEDNNKVWGITPEEMIYFEASLQKGENNIIVEYEGSPQYNKYGLLRTFEIHYALYPSNYWKSFGPIEIDLQLPENMEVRDTNTGKLQKVPDNAYKINIDSVSTDNLNISFSKKLSFIGRVLLFIEPVGISAITLLIMVYFHIMWMRKRRRAFPKKFNYTVLLGALIVSLVVSAVFIFANDLIIWVIDEQGMKQGYILLAVLFIGPFLFFFYSIFAGIIDYAYKKRINQNTTS
ncbi:hypothetical protein [Elizabethkingia meningoseptica]|uniref:hypothetical protein n=1 Tax=Elizabethkingia meningoseptica TaxID=238 RepID=UPI0023AE9EBA|nr:hypothetical protein [Elizabethkingia meningoseptica]